MTKKPVRCWRISLPVNDGKSKDGWITYPEDNSGHDLIICTKCGNVYGVSVSEMVYIGPPLEEKLRSVECSRCKSVLSETGMRYPENYIDDCGNTYAYERGREIPADDLSEVREFEQIY